MKRTNHSFQNILNKNSDHARAYVTSEVRTKDFIKFLTPRIKQTSQRLAIDIGCGSGLLSHALSPLFQDIVSCDLSPDNVELAANAAAQKGLHNINVFHQDALSLSVEQGKADVVILNGVLEWVGVNDKGLDPRDLQIQYLKKIRQMISQNGFLYFAIENRWAPCMIRQDPHVKLPLVCALPRSLASLLTMIIKRSKYQTYIYGKNSLEKMLTQAGFEKIESFTALPSYQYPFAYVPLSSYDEVMKSLNEVDLPQMEKKAREVHLDFSMKDMFAKLYLRASLRLFNLTAPSLIFIAYPKR